LSTPDENITKEDFLLANIPDNYIRTAEYYRVNYRLNQMISNRIQINNIAYSLQLSDLFNYILYRINLFGVIKNLFIKNAIMNIVSIQEGILYSSITTLNNFCWIKGKVCNSNSTCQFYVKLKNQLTFNSLLQTFQDKIGFYHERYRTMMFTLKEIRDNIHIQDIQYSELAVGDLYSIEKYHDALLSLRYMKFRLHRSLEEFKVRRNAGCSKRRRY